MANKQDAGVLSDSVVQFWQLAQEMLHAFSSELQAQFPWKMLSVSKHDIYVVLATSSG